MKTLRPYADFRDGLAAALDPRFWTLDWLDREVTAGRALFRSGDASAIVARIEDYPTGERAIHGLCATGELDEIVGRMIPEAEALGRSIGCGSALISSREAWVRVLREHGYSLHQSTISKALR